MSTRKRKANSKYDDEESEFPIKRAKSTTETPSKRAPASRKRKENLRYDDEDDEDDEYPLQGAESTSETPIKRIPAPRAVKTKRGDPDWLVTNEKSPLAYEDLHAELSDPRTYEGFTREDWEDLRSTLPENVPLNPDGNSISWDFLKYDRDFRRGVREFQEDLSTGRLDPEWQAAAAEAMEERARGDYDAYKEKNYEEFWGQKQKLAYDVLAGESTSLKLETMVENGMFKVGDEFVFTRAIGRKEKRVLIEKELKIIAVGNNTLTFGIPPGQLKFPRPYKASQPTADTKANKRDPLVNKVGPVDAMIDDKMDENQVLVEDKFDSNGPKAGTLEHDPLNEGVSLSDEVQPENAAIDTEMGGEEKTTERNGLVIGTHERDMTFESLESGGGTARPNEHTDDNNSLADTNGTGNGPPKSALELPEPPEAAIYHEIKNLKQLMDKAIEVDGRLDPRDIKSVPAASPWKFMRVKRKNQDLGTLFEMRDEFYAYKLPKLAKPRKK